MNKTDEVSTFMSRLEHPLKPEIEALRTTILGADEKVRESVKWNAPSFFVKEHFATLKLRPVETVQVVFHTGAKVRADITNIEIYDPSGLLKWLAKDRGIVTFSDMKDVASKKSALVAVVRQWLEQM